MADNRETPLAELMAKVVTAYLSNHVIPRADLVRLISITYAAFQGLSRRQSINRQPQAPAIAIRKSITPDCIYCLEDGIGFKSLRRHLKARYGLTPDQYRQKWGLPADYPMVAPNYSARRSELARAHGLGRNNDRSPKRQTGSRIALQKRAVHLPQNGSAGDSVPRNVRRSIQQRIEGKGAPE